MTSPNTWIDLNLDSQVSNCVRDWIELPISSCVSEILSLPSNQCGLGIPSLREVAETLRLNQRFKQHLPGNAESETIWKLTTGKNMTIDRIILGSDDQKLALRVLKETQTRNNINHFHTLTIQGQIINAINEAFAKSTVTKWMKEIEKLAPPLYQRCNESSFPRVRVESESARLESESESESRCVGLESESESSRFRVRVRVRVQVFVSRVRIRVPRRKIGGL